MKIKIKYKEKRKYVNFPHLGKLIPININSEKEIFFKK